MKTKAVILAGGAGTRLAALTIKRAKPAVPFAGKYRIIDFTLSNCVNSNIFDVLILTQYRPHSLNEHIDKGRPWDLDRTFTGGVQLLQPYKGHFDTDWYAGTADAVEQNINFVRHGSPQEVLILSGDHIYRMNYALLVQFHRQKKAHATVCAIRVPMDEASRFGILDVGEDNRIRDFIEKPPNPPGNLASMGVYMFQTDVLEQVLHEDHQRPDSSRDFGKDILPRMVEQGMDVYAYPYDDYWIDVGTLDAYWETHMDLLNSPPPFDLNDRKWVIHTRSEEYPPVRVDSMATIKNSLITDGTVIAEGAVVERSVLSPGVYVGPGALVRESIIFNDVYIEAGANIERCIIDKSAVIGHNTRIGSIQDFGDLQITCIGKNTHIPAGYTIERGSILGADLGAENFAEFEGKTVPDGTHLGFVTRK